MCTFYTRISFLKTKYTLKWNASTVDLGRPVRAFITNEREAKKDICIALMSGRFLFYSRELILSILDINLQANVFNVFYVLLSEQRKIQEIYFFGLYIVLLIYPLELSMWVNYV